MLGFLGVVIKKQGVETEDFYLFNKSFHKANVNFKKCT